MISHIVSASAVARGEGCAEEGGGGREEGFASNNTLFGTGQPSHIFLFFWSTCFIFIFFDGNLFHVNDWELQQIQELAPGYQSSSYATGSYYITLYCRTIPSTPLDSYFLCFTLYYSYVTAFLFTLFYPIL